MPGLYLHIPFCKQACHYCDFHFSTSRALQGQFVEALVKEMALRRDYFPTPAAPLDTIYFRRRHALAAHGRGAGLDF